MNKIFATMMLLLLNLNIYAADLTKNEATHLVLSHLSIDSTSCEMYVFDEIKKAGSTIKLLTSQLTIPSYDSWVYFVDDKPFANWGKYLSACKNGSQRRRNAAYADCVSLNSYLQSMYCFL